MWITFPYKVEMAILKKIFFSILHKSECPVLSLGGLKCPGLVDGKAFHQPAEFLSGQGTDFAGILRPLESSLCIKTLV